MKGWIPSSIFLTIAVSLATLGVGCGTANEGGVNATKSIKDAKGPTSQEEYARQQLEKNAAAKKATKPAH